MPHADWQRVDDYLEQMLLRDDEALQATLAANAEAGLPAIDVSPTQGKFLALMVAIGGARRVLEIGTLGAYSTLWMARALAGGGELVTLEADPHHARVARANIARAGLAERVHLIEGRALDTLPTLAGQAPFDFVFIDADKPNNANYLRQVLALTRPGAVIVLDNVVRQGAVTEADSDDPNVQGVREGLALIAGEPRLEATALQTVGAKGWDGFALLRVR